MESGKMRGCSLLLTGMLLLGAMLFPAAAGDVSADTAADEAVVTYTGETLPVSEEDGELLTNYCEVNLLQCGSITGAMTMPYDRTTMAEDDLYNTILTGIQNKSEKIDISSCGLTATIDANGQWVGDDIDTLKTTYEKVVNDHPELFYARNGYGYGGTSSDNVNVNLTVVEPMYYTSNTSEIETMEAAFNSAVAKAKSQLKGDETDLEKLLVLHDYLVVNCKYDWAVATGKNATDEWVYSAYGAFVNQDAVCQGYTLAYKLLLNEYNITSTTLSSESMNHIWNQVYLDDNWYHVDVTWDDPVPNLEGYCGHNNFLLSKTGIQSTGHNWSEANGEIAMDATSTRYESGNAFNGVTNALYRQGDDYYYVYLNGFESYTVQKIAKEDLTDANKSEAIGTIKVFMNVISSVYSSWAGVVWQDDCLYYVNPDKQLVQYSLTYGTGRTFGDAIDFTAAASLDAKYGALQDTIGLRLSDDEKSIVANSRTRPDLTLATVPISDPQSYPATWDEAGETGVTQLLGIDMIDSQLGVVLSSEDKDSAQQVLLAFYQDGKMIDAVQNLSVTNSAGLQILSVELPDSSTYDEYRLFLTTDGFVPLCKAFTSAAQS